MAIPSSTTDLGEGELDTPHFALVAEAVFTDDLQFGIAESILGTVDMSGARSRSVVFYVQTGGLERSPWDLVGLGVDTSVQNRLAGAESILGCQRCSCFRWCKMRGFC